MMSYRRTQVWRRWAKGCGLALLSLMPALALSQEPLRSASEIQAALEAAPSDTAGLTRRFVPKANPDASTRVCDAQLNAKLLRDTGLQGEELTRTLVPEAAPGIDLAIAFARGEATLLPEGIRQLDELARVLTQGSFARERFALAGHTDREGEAAYNDRLSCERALAARRFLSERHRIAPERLVPLGFGFSKLKNQQDPYAAVNRRVEIRRFDKVAQTNANQSP